MFVSYMISKYRDCQAVQIKIRLYSIISVVVADGLVNQWAGASAARLPRLFRVQTHIVRPPPITPNPTPLSKPTQVPYSYLHDFIHMQLIGKNNSSSLSTRWQRKNIFLRLKIHVKPELHIIMNKKMYPQIHICAKLRLWNQPIKYHTV